MLTLDEADKVVCHVCGQAYRGLDHHARQAHGLWPEAYRVLFRLERRRALENPTLRARRRELAQEQLRPWREQIRDLATRITPEQRAARSRGKTRRLETLQDPDNRAQWREGGRRARQIRRARIAAGHRERPQGFQAGTATAQEAAARGRARRQELGDVKVFRQGKFYISRVPAGFLALWGVIWPSPREAVSSAPAISPPTTATARSWQVPRHGRCSSSRCASRLAKSWFRQDPTR